MPRSNTPPRNLAPKVSVVLPTYNRAEQLPASMASVLAQTYTDLELLVVDDGSTDDTRAVISSIADPRIRYIQSNHQGAAAARNLGITAARGHFVAFQDSDDHWTCDKLALQVAAMNDAEEDTVGVFCRFIRYLDGRAEAIPATGFTAGPALFEQLLSFNVVNTPCLLATRAALMQIRGFDEALPRYQDWDLAIRLTLCGKLAFLPMPLLLASQTPGSITASHKAGEEALTRFITKYRSHYDTHQTALADIFLSLARHLYRQGRATDARRYVLRAMHHNGPRLRYLRTFLLGR